MSISPDEERPVDLEGVPPEEGFSTADAASRVELDPENQPNFTEQELRGEESSDDS
jgi:hypothetical protein